MIRAFILCALLGAICTSCGVYTDASFNLPKGDIDFIYEMNGSPHSIAALRGRPVFLVLVRISEATSLMYLDEVKVAFARAAGKTRFVVLSLDANEAPLLAAFAEIETLPFPVGLADTAVAMGQSSLGIVPVVPTSYLIDERGHVVDMAPGVTSADRIEGALLARGY